MVQLGTVRAEPVVVIMPAQLCCAQAPQLVQLLPAPVFFDPGFKLLALLCQGRLGRFDSKHASRAFIVFGPEKRESQEIEYLLGLSFLEVDHSALILIELESELIQANFQVTPEVFGLVSQFE